MARYRNMPVGDHGGATFGPYFDAVTYGTPEGYKTILTAKANAVLPAIAGGADLAVGVKALTLPAGERIVTGSSLAIALKQSEDNITADTPDVGLGTTIASGAVAVLGGTAAFENILTGQTAADCDGTATVATVTTALAIGAAASHDIYLNVADGWAASGDAAAQVSGSITVWWR